METLKNSGTNPNKTGCSVWKFIHNPDLQLLFKGPRSPDTWLAHWRPRWCRLAGVDRTEELSTLCHHIHTASASPVLCRRLSIHSCSKHTFKYNTGQKKSVGKVEWKKNLDTGNYTWHLKKKMSHLRVPKKFRVKYRCQIIITYLANIAG